MYTARTLNIWETLYKIKNVLDSFNGFIQRKKQSINEVLVLENYGKMKFT